MISSFEKLQSLLGFDRTMRDSARRAHGRGGEHDWSSLLSSVQGSVEKIPELLDALELEIGSLQKNLQVDLSHSLIESAIKRIEMLVLIVKHQFAVDTADRLTASLENLVDNVGLGGFDESQENRLIFHMGRLSDVCFELFDNEDYDRSAKLSLANLNSIALSTINRIKISSLDDELGSIAFNTFRSCLLAERCGGLNDSAAEIRAEVFSDLRAVGPIVSEKVAVVTKVGIAHVTDINEFDHLVSYASCLTFFAIYGAEEDWAKHIAKAHELFKNLASRLSDYPDRAPLVIMRAAGAFHYEALRLHIDNGLSNQKLVLSAIGESVRMLARITGKKPDRAVSGIDKMKAELLEIRLLNLAIAAGRSDATFLEATKQRSLAFLKRYQDRSVSLVPFVALKTCYGYEKDPVSSAKLDLRDFLSKQEYESLQSRAQRLLELLSREESATLVADAVGSWWEVGRNSLGVLPFLAGYESLELEQRVKVHTAVSQHECLPGSLKFYLREYLKLDAGFAFSKPNEKISNWSMRRVNEFVKLFSDNFGSVEEEFVSGFSRQLLDRGVGALPQWKTSLLILLLELATASVDDESFFTKLVEVYRATGELEPALLAGERALRTFPNSSSVLLQHSISLLEANDDLSVIDLISDFSASSSSSASSMNPSLRSIYATCLSKRGLRREAMPLFQRLARERPNDALNRLRLGRLLYDDGADSFQDAMNEYLAAICADSAFESGKESWVFRQSCFGIAQILRDSAGAGNGIVLGAYEDIFARMPDGVLVGILKAHEISGGFTSEILNCVRLSDPRKNIVLDRALFSCLTAKVVEDTVWGRDLSYADDLVELAEKRKMQHSLFGGSKGSYRRFLIRTLSEPIVHNRLLRTIDEQSFDIPNLTPLLDAVATTDISTNYYRSVVDGVNAAQRTGGLVGEHLVLVALNTCKAFLPDVAKQAIRFEDWEPRIFNAHKEGFEGFESSRELSLNCDPDFIRALKSAYDLKKPEIRDRFVEWGVSIPAMDFPFLARAEGANLVLAKNSYDKQSIRSFH